MAIEYKNGNQCHPMDGCTYIVETSNGTEILLWISGRGWYFVNNGRNCGKACESNHVFLVYRRITLKD